MAWSDMFHHPVMQGALAGVISAAVVDFGAFRSWKTFGDAYSYDWPTAVWRWFQGAVVGIMTGLGMNFTGA